MTHRGPFQPLPFCDSVINRLGLTRVAAQPRKVETSFLKDVTLPDFHQNPVVLS